MRPRRAQPEDAQGRPAESEAICGKEQRRLTKQLMIFSLKKDQAVFAWFFLWLTTSKFPFIPRFKHRFSLGYIRCGSKKNSSQIYKLSRSRRR
ncbi:hypothetical protein AB685_12485 [Bacillus sp. LL01]|nr:hypothetical protein AB685_12485 [Bacillus sp. LL01]